jgi:hypothetical protein
MFTSGDVLAATARVLAHFNQRFTEVDLTPCSTPLTNVAVRTAGHDEVVPVHQHLESY